MNINNFERGNIHGFCEKCAVRWEKKKELGKYSHKKIDSKKEEWEEFFLLLSYNNERNKRLKSIITFFVIILSQWKPLYTWILSE